MNAVQIAGTRFGRLVAVKPTVERRRRSVVWECLCDCGVTALVAADKLKSGTTKSCGCLRTEIHTKHGMTETPEFSAWASMRGRCYNPASNRYHTHGARGIKVCDRWLESFENFYTDMGNRPSPSHSLERKDNDGSYEPSNCVWATPQEQAENRRTTLQITVDGTTKSLKAWCRDLGLPYVRTWKRLYRLGWPLNKAFSK